ncbi:hypothetical protein K431DRAFT_340411 [Polychaeton citri CBS 116435]|uniref:Ribosomal RNA methyltransferase FtsJ domain-containing protein n=1 Tax=Polychaeton citri CBS 116435 TaxID=1314669 RepID=A0A9P4Q1D8_9PEZI|nr:hypothetical protein K431DRAFT_340411 [Polychaeton citri CBS 116435]
MAKVAATHVEELHLSRAVRTENDIGTNESPKSLENTISDGDDETQNAGKVIYDYLTERVEEFRKLCEVRQRGWNNKSGDEYFRKQRNESDKLDSKQNRYYFKMMQEIGKQLHRSTNAFKLPESGNSTKLILDLCMAPGAFLDTAMKANPGSRALGFSLPASDGGYHVRIPNNPNMTLKLIDITMLAADMGITEISAGHPDASEFLQQEFSRDDLFDLVLCDGQVLRTHLRSPYRESREATRLMVVQLALGLEHINPGGTMVALLHRVESVKTASLLHTFSKFSSVELFKPAPGHAKRSSFYMVATEIQASHPEAIAAIRAWKRTWEVATFGDDDEYQTVLRRDSKAVEDMLQDFGPSLIKLGKKVWDVQAKALAKAPFMQHQ